MQRGSDSNAPSTPVAKIRHRRRSSEDFGDSIPGHGGITDRMDCQMVMAVFAYIYHQSFVVSQSFSVDLILDQITMNLSFEEQQALYMRLGQIFLERQYGQS